MRALVLDGGVRFVTDHPAPQPKEGEALIRPILAGVCDTDIQLAKGYMTFQGVLGHEFVGEVLRAPDESLVGRRVVGEINIACGSCRFCREGLKNHCPERTVMGIMGKDGAFAELLALPVENLHIVPDAIPDEAAVFTEPLAAAFQAVEQIGPADGASVAVLGDGKLGLLAAMALALSGGAVTAVGRHPEKLGLLEGENVTTALSVDMAGAESLFDVVVEATGSPSGLEDAMRLVKPRGTIVLKTTVAQRGPFDLNRLVIDEVSLVGSRCGPFGKALRALEDGSVNPRPLVSAVLPLGEGERALREAGEGGTLKILLSMD
ncbi:MAG: MDR/zinc-dependent alcohol dehydrogenase-like family protein [Candidatus Nitrospinota bacterium M3_3B_026]